MAYCLNPDCSRPHNPDNNQYCHGCGKNLNETSQSYDFRYRFRLVKLLGQGGFGRTYKAQDLDFYQRPCASTLFSHRRHLINSSKI